MKKPKAPRKPENALASPSFGEVAALLVPADTPTWQKKYLESWVSLPKTPSALA